MSFDYDGGYYHCPYCGNNGDQASVFQSGTEWVRGTRWIQNDVIELMDSSCSEYSEEVDSDGVEVDEVTDFDPEGFECQNCGKNFGEFEWMDHEDWEYEWGGDDEILSKANDQRLSERGARKVADIKTILKSGDSASAQTIANSIRTPKELDKALNLYQGEGFNDYELYLEGPYASPSSRRLFKVGQELVAWGYRSIIGGTIEPGKYAVRVWAWKGQIDDELELDMAQSMGHTEVRHALKLSIFGQDIVGGFEVKKEIYLIVPAIQERQEGKDDPENQVVIFEMPPGLVKKIRERDQDCTESAWPGDLIDRLTFYKCERSKLAQTLEVVFDMTSEGYLPLLVEKAVA